LGHSAHMVGASNMTGFEDEGVPTFLFDFDQFEKMEEAGVFDAQFGRVELIEGRLIEMAPAGGDHADVTSDLLFLLADGIRAFGIEGLRSLTQGTLKISDHSGPEPDVFVARRRVGQKYYESADAVLIVEVAVSTVDTDRALKRPMYARAGIPEFWIVEPESRSIRVHRRPGPDGIWGEETSVTDGTVSPLFAPDIRICLADLFRGA